MRTAAAASTALSTGRAIIVDLVTLTIPRKWYLSDGTLVEAPAVARWTSHDRSLLYGGNTFRGLYHGFEELERSVHEHVHVENNILFPLAARIAAALEESAHARA